MGVCLCAAIVAETHDNLGVFSLHQLTQSVYNVFREDAWLELNLSVHGLVD